MSSRSRNYFLYIRRFTVQNDSISLLDSIESGQLSHEASRNNLNWISIFFFKQRILSSLISHHNLGGQVGKSSLNIYKHNIFILFYLFYSFFQQEKCGFKRQRGRRKIGFHDLLSHETSTFVIKIPQFSLNNYVINFSP